MNFAEIIKTEKDEGKEKHIPHMEITKGYREGKNIVRVVVGHETPHPNTTDHHIVWIELYGIKKDSDQVVNIGRADCSPVYSNPNVRFQINDMEDFQAFHALAYCNIHGLWSNSLER